MIEQLLTDAVLEKIELCLRRALRQEPLRSDASASILANALADTINEMLSEHRQ